MKMDMHAYRRNIKAACKAEGNRIPQGYSTRIADNGDFVVTSAYETIGRLPAGQWEKF